MSGEEKRWLMLVESLHQNGSFPQAVGNHLSVG